MKMPLVNQNRPRIIHDAVGGSLDDLQLRRIIELVASDVALFGCCRLPNRLWSVDKDRRQVVQRLVEFIVNNATSVCRGGTSTADPTRRGFQFAAGRAALTGCGHVMVSPVGVVMVIVWSVWRVTV